MIEDTRSAVRVEGPQEPVREGEMFYVSVQVQEPASVEGIFHGRRVVFYPDSPDGQSPKKFTAMVGVEDGMGRKNAEMSIQICPRSSLAMQRGLAAAPAPVLTAASSPARTSSKRSMSDGADAGLPVPSVDSLIGDTAPVCQEHVIGVRTEAGVFPSETLSVPPRTIEPAPKDKLRIAREMKLIRQVYAVSANERLWDPPVRMPVNLGITSQWGARRVYNGRVTNAHYGTDMRAPTGTPIRSPLAGRVVLSRKLFFTGYTVILDHGYGLFTLYGHLSKLKAPVGKLVKKGHVLGLAGATGRASGPHLHWGVKLHGAKIDPMAMARLMK